MLMDIPEILKGTKVIPFTEWVTGYLASSSINGQKPSLSVLNEVARFYNQKFEHYFMEQYFVQAENVMTNTEEDITESIYTLQLFKADSHKFYFIDNRYDEAYPESKTLAHMIDTLSALKLYPQWRDKIEIKS